MATSNTQPHLAETKPGQLPTQRLQIARLQDLLDQLSQRLGTSDYSHLNSELDPAQLEKDNSTRGPSKSFISSLDTVTDSMPLLENTALVPLLNSALDKTTNLFTIEPPRSPGAERQMSYSLNVNAKYHTHMDDAPARAAELEKDLSAAKLSTESMRDLVEECKTIAGHLAKEHRQTKYRPAAVSEDVDGMLHDIKARGGGEVRGRSEVRGESRTPDGLTLEERMKRAEIRSEHFL